MTTRSRRFDLLPRGERGQILILTATMLIVLFGIAALAVDISYLYDKRNRLQHAADAAAKAVSLELVRNSTLTNAQQKLFADNQVSLNGFTPAACGATSGTSVCVYQPPIDGSLLSGTYVEVKVSEQTNSFFARVLSSTWATITPMAYAVAAYNDNNNNCLITLAGTGTFTTGSGTTSVHSLHLGTSVTTGMNMPNCWIASSGDFDLQGSVNGTVQGVTAVAASQSGSGTWSGATPIYGAIAPSDPLSGKLVAPTPVCSGNPPVGADATSGTISAGCYHNITIPSGGTLNLNPGEYKITGVLKVAKNGGSTRTLTGTHVLIYIASGGQIDLSNNSAVVGTSSSPLSAQTSGTNKGVVIWSASTLDANFSGNNGTYYMSGGLYFPSSYLNFGNAVTYANSDCLVLVAQWLSVGNGNSSFSNVCSASGGSPLVSGNLVE